MMNLWWKNLASLAATVITASSCQTLYPAANVANDQPTTVWISGYTNSQEWVMVDFGGIAAITDFICAFFLFINPNTALIQGNASSDFTSPAFSAPVTLLNGVMFASFAVQKFRYWRFIFTKGTPYFDDSIPPNPVLDDEGNQEYTDTPTSGAQIGRVFLGQKVQINLPDLDNGVQPILQDLSEINTSKGGQDYGLFKPSKRLFTLTWTNALGSDKRTLYTIYKAGGKVLKFFIQIDPANLTADPDCNSIVYVRFNQDPQNLESDAMDQEQCWDMEQDFLEQI